MWFCTYIPNRSECKSGLAPSSRVDVSLSPFLHPHPKSMSAQISFCGHFEIDLSSRRDLHSHRKSKWAQAGICAPIANRCEPEFRSARSSRIDERVSLNLRAHRKLLSLLILERQLESQLNRNPKDFHRNSTGRSCCRRR